MIDDLVSRLDTLERQLTQQLQRRDQARAVLEQSTVTIHQLQGAIAVVRELLNGAEPAAAAEPS
jgi:hypothetical protein